MMNLVMRLIDFNHPHNLYIDLSVVYFLEQRYQKYNKIIQEPSPMQFFPCKYYLTVILFPFLLSLSSSSILIQSDLNFLNQQSLSTTYNTQSSLKIFQLLNWMNNNELILSINNSTNSTFKAAHNQFSYLSQPQITHNYLTLQMPQFYDVKVQSPQLSLALKSSVKDTLGSPQKVQTTNRSSLSIDWRGKLVGAVRNQGKCGACWAFAAAADLEASYRLKYQIQVDFSQQQLIDCSTLQGNIGCAGGMMTNAYQYVIKQGVTLEYFYPYEQTTNSCTYDPTRMPHFRISSSNIIYGSCSELENILKQRPVSVVISADVNFIFYKSGILNTCGQTINHAIQLVGLIKNSTSNFYIGRNSWGTQWGEGGYVYIDSTINNGNLCNVCTYPQYPL